MSPGEGRDLKQAERQTDRGPSLRWDSQLASVTRSA